MHIVLKTPTIKAENVWDDDLEPLRKIQKEILYPDKSPLSGFDQSKSSVPPKTKLRVSRVHSDDESSNNESPTSFQPSKLLAKAYPEIGTVCADTKDIGDGLYVLVEM